MTSALVWTERLARYRFRPGHPLDPRRLELTMALIRSLGLAGAPDRPIVEPRDADDEALLTVHGRAYVDAVRAVSHDPRAPVDAAFGLGTDDVPVTAGMHEMARAAVGATLTAVALVAEGRATRVFSPAGGLHHAMPEAAAGFCVYNDLAVAIRWLQREHGMRVLYLDYDAHHGDGVQRIFYDDPGVLTISLHESGLYLFPATGFIDELGSGDGHGFSINVPLEAQTDDASFCSAFELVVPDAARAFRPDIIVVQGGCDAHALDPLTHLRCTTRLYETLAARVVELAEELCDGRVVVTGGGGYAIHQVVPRAWTLTWAALCGDTPPDPLPADWLHAVRGETTLPVPGTLRDPEDLVPPTPNRDEVRRTNEMTARTVARRALPLISGWGLAF